MTEHKETPSKCSGLKHRVWVKSVGIELTPTKDKAGDYFWTFRFTRAFKRGGGWEYTDSFSSHNDAALNEAIVQMIRFRDSTNANRWVAERMESPSEHDAGQEVYGN